MQYDFEEYKKNFFSFERKPIYACAFYYNYLNIKPSLVGLTEKHFLMFQNEDVQKFYLSYCDNHPSTSNFLFFDNEKECTDAYNQLVYKKADEIDKEIKSLVKENEDIKSNFIDTDYMIEKLRRND